MNREIKFRAWDSISKEMHQWDKIKNIPLSNFQMYEHYTLMQFTELTDKNGVKIFEGDVLTNHQNKKGLIVFDEGKFCIETKRQNNTVWFMPLDKGFLKNKEIIGNIYENKNLIL